MQKWEYLVVEWAYPGSNDSPPWRVNLHELPNWKEGPALPKYLNQLGDEGWELASFVCDTPSKTAVFKRPKG